MVFIFPARISTNICHTKATKLLFNPSASSGTHTVRGVEFTVSGQKYEVSASREVVLCCGAVQTPQLLELSGTYLLAWCQL